MSSPLSDLAFRNAPVQIGKYTLLARLASGGMGEVYVARMSAAAGFEKQVVVKRLLPELARDQQFVKLFLEEARLTARLSHPNICQVFELTAIDGEYFLVMEYLEGLSLSSLFHSYEDTGLDLKVATGLITQACEGLEYAHAFQDLDNGVHGIVHRDVSPHNLMLTVSGVVKLLDFGVAKLRREGQHTVTGSAKGKYAYMAPEQLNCLQLDRRADLFAVAVVLFELITGQRLFRRRSELATMQAIVDGERPLLHEVRRDVPRALSDLLSQTLAVEREERPASARAFADAVRVAMAPLGGPAPLGDLAEFIREHHHDELAEQRTLIKNATGRVPRVAPDDDEAVTRMDQSRPRTVSGEAIRRRLPLRAPTASRILLETLPGDFDDDAATMLDPRLQTGSDISVDFDPEVSESVRPAPARNDDVAARYGSRPESDYGLDLDYDLRPRRKRPLWPVAGLLVALGVAAFFLWPRGTDRNTGPAADPDSVAIATHTAKPPESDTSAPKPPDGPSQTDGDSTSGTDERGGATNAGTGTTDGPATTPGPDSSGPDSSGPDVRDTDKADDEAEERARRERQRKRRRDRERKVETPATGSGYLTIDASPYAEIFIDGHKAGVTPLVRVKLAAGDHKIRAVSAKGNKQFRVTIGKDTTTKKRIVF